MITPDTAQPHLTLLTAAARFDELSLRDALASMAGDEATGGPPPLAREEALELLALGELIARKAAYGRQLAVRSARASGASWSQIGAALGISKQAAWDAHSQWIEDQAERHRRDGVSGMDPDMADDSRSLAGEPGPTIRPGHQGSVSTSPAALSRSTQQRRTGGWASAPHRRLADSEERTWQAA